ncbi:MAG TPA: alanine racemase [Candidatus Paceibacterota bacterium]
MKSAIKSAFRKILRKKDDIPSLININISKSALLYNLNQFRKAVGDRDVAPVLKGNAYSHGLREIVNILKDEKVPFFIIDSYFEAKVIRNEGIKTPLLIVGYVIPENINNSKLKNIIYTIGSIDTLKSINRETRIHIKIDTGMHRQGIALEDIDDAIKIIKENKKIKLEGICSHLADADNTDSAYTKDQIRKWNSAVEIWKEAFPDLQYFHISASVGINYREAKANLIRLGIGLYGLIEIDGVETKPILEMKTIISSIKKIKKGECIGYGCTFSAIEDMTIATIPMGYYEGIDRRLSNTGEVKIGNIFCPIVGRVSMNIATIDISRIVNAKIGDEVIVISKNRKDKNSIENIAKICETIPYEISVYIAQHLKRNVVE